MVRCLLILVLLAGCGTRKRQAQISTEKKEIIRIDKKDISTNVRTEKYATKTTYTPIEKDKEMVLPDGRTGVNVVIVDEAVNSLDELQAIDKGVIVEEIKEKTKDKTSNVETKKPNPWLWGAVVVIVLGIVYILRSKFLP